MTNYEIASVWYKELPDKLIYGGGWVPFCVHPDKIEGNKIEGREYPERGYRVWLRRRVTT